LKNCFGKSLTGVGVLEKNTQGRSGIIYALTMMLLAGRPPKTGSSSNPLLSLQPNRLPKFGKEKEPGVLRMQADTVMLNPGSTSENKIALIITVITVITVIMSLQMT